MILHYELRHTISPAYSVYTNQETVSDLSSIFLVKTATKKSMFNISRKTLSKCLCIVHSKDTRTASVDNGVPFVKFEQQRLFKKNLKTFSSCKEFIRRNQSIDGKSYKLNP